MEAVVFFQIYELRVMETKPDKAVSIIECDMNVRSQTTPEYSVVFSAENSHVSQVDFDAPLGYKEPERQPQHQEEPTVRTRRLHKTVCHEHVDPVNVFTGRRRCQQLC